MRQTDPQKHLPLHESAASAAVSTGVLQARWHCDLKHTILVNEARQASGEGEFSRVRKGEETAEEAAQRKTGQLEALVKCVRNTAKRSHACLVDCRESCCSELLLLSSHGEELQCLWTEGSADLEDRIHGHSPGSLT